MRKVPAVCAQIVHKIHGPYTKLCTTCAQTTGTLRMIATRVYVRTDVDNDDDELYVGIEHQASRQESVFIVIDW